MKTPAGGARFWITWGLLLWLGRALLLLWLYFTPAPGGGPLVDNWTRFLPHSLVAEAGVIAGFTALAMLLDRILGAYWRGARRLLAWTASTLGVLYLMTAHLDAELMRWMSQHLTFSWIVIYLGQGLDAEFTARILGGAAVAFFLGLAFTVTASLLLILWTRRAPAPGSGSPPSWIAVVLVLALAFAGGTSKWWFGKSSMRWRRIQPVAWVLGNDLIYRGAHALKPPGYEEGIRWLAASGNPGAAPRAGRHPFWKEEPSENASMAAFRARPPDQKPDIVVLWIESLRGWTVDMRDPAACANVPNLCALAAGGLFFPHVSSTGFPSVEGFSGLHLGVWSHPSGVLLSDRATIRNRSLNDILGKAGYYRAALTAAGPTFDNLTPWFDRWYDFWEYDPSRHNDHTLADRLAWLLGEVPADQPLFALWMSTTTHVPFTLPPGHGPNTGDPRERYLRALAYTDSAIGVALEAIRNGPRRRPTIVLVAGDHAIPNRPLYAAIDEDGAPSQGHTWTALWLAGPGVPRGETRARPVSHVDIAPTLLALLDLKASNHFVGGSLLATPAPRDSAGASRCAEGARVLAFRLGGMAAQRGACRRLLRLDDADFTRSFRQDLHPRAWPAERVEGYRGDARVEPTAADRSEWEAMRRGGEAWRWVLDHNLLMP
jgi:lipoteichoic acid synthase